MHVDPFQISLDTLIASSSLLGHFLEDRSNIRDSQDQTLLNWLQSESTVQLSKWEQRPYFCIAPFDILVSESNGEKQFHLLEMNGTGIGGLTNLSFHAVQAVLLGLTQMAQNFRAPDTLLLVASSGKEWDEAPRANRLIHEKMLYLEALRQGFQVNWGSASVLGLPQIIQDPKTLQSGKPTVVLGYIKDFLCHLQLDKRGCLYLFGRPVHGAVNDRFCHNIMQRFDHQLDLTHFVPMNRSFLAGSDKGIVYQLLHEYLQKNPHLMLPNGVAFQCAPDRDSLIAVVLDWVAKGCKTVIKPCGTGLGHGIEFFLSANEPEQEIIARIDASIEQTKQYYQLPHGAFPYTVCEYVDSCVITHCEHPLYNHKYELRVVVYRDGINLKAFPSIVKIASLPAHAPNMDRLCFINNISTSAHANNRSGTDYMLPLTNRKTLTLLNLRMEQLRQLCVFCTHFMRYVLDVLHEQPHVLGLPGIPISATVLPMSTTTRQAA
ncbi:MAG: hypothetical protein ACK4RK_00345 [Gemmataceae bacterium]